MSGESRIVRNDRNETATAVFEIHVSKFDQTRMDRMLWAEFEHSLQEVFEAALGEADEHAAAVRRRLWILRRLHQLGAFIGFLIWLAIVVVCLRVIFEVIVRAWGLIP